MSKQNFHQQLGRQLLQEEEKAQLLIIVRQIRDDHPTMGAKVMYRMIHPKSLNRDKFIEFYNQEGFKIKREKNYRRTTNSSGVIRFPNLILDFQLTAVNQIFVSDITYYQLSNRFYYLTFIMDLYSRMIKGYSVSKTLRTLDTTIPAVEMLMSKLPPRGNSILHSDGGGQYYSKDFLSITKGVFRHSMCETIYENAHAERINGTIKNSYIKPYNPRNFSELNKVCTAAIKKYNQFRPHQSLNYLSPLEFELQQKKMKLVNQNMSNTCSKVVNSI
jgi:transposase InsO family protein